MPSLLFHGKLIEHWTELGNKKNYTKIKFLDDVFLNLFSKLSSIPNLYLRPCLWSNVLWWPSDWWLLFFIIISRWVARITDVIFGSNNNTSSRRVGFVVWCVRSLLRSYDTRLCFSVWRIMEVSCRAQNGQIFQQACQKFWRSLMVSNQWFNLN